MTSTQIAKVITKFFYISLIAVTYQSIAQATGLLVDIPFNMVRIHNTFGTLLSLFLLLGLYGISQRNNKKPTLEEYTTALSHRDSKSFTKLFYRLVYLICNIAIVLIGIEGGVTYLTLLSLWLMFLGFLMRSNLRASYDEIITNFEANSENLDVEEDIKNDEESNINTEKESW